MKIDIIEESAAALPEYARIPISFEVRSVLDVQFLAKGLNGISPSECPVGSPWVKDYDALNGEGPLRWAEHWDIANWGILSAFENGTRLGGCAIAWNTIGVQLLDGRNDLAVLWDIRVLPQCRGNGIGSHLIEAALAWARSHGCHQVKIETQNINVPACRLYAKHGFKLSSINRHAYPELPDESQIIWCNDLL